MLSRLKATLAILIAILILVWPLTHMVLAKNYGLNSWKLSGWGMYASVHPDDTFINMYFVEDGSKPLVGLETGQVVTWNFPVLYQDGESHLLEVDAFNDEIMSIDFTGYRHNIAVFRRERDIQEFTEQFVTHMKDPVELGYALVFVAQPRVNIWQQIAYTDTEVYMVKDQCIQNLGRYQSDEMSGAEILAIIEEEAVTVSEMWTVDGCNR